MDKDQEIEKIERDTYNQLYSLMECGCVPTKLELDRFITGLGYQKPSTAMKEDVVALLKAHGFTSDGGWSVEDIAGEILSLIEPKVLSEENKKLRDLLWESHSCEGKYGDDGELQCNRIPFVIDFKRDSVAEIERKCAIHNCQRQGITIPEFLIYPKPQ